jgi:hypothetical protein
MQPTYSSRAILDPGINISNRYKIMINSPEVTLGILRVYSEVFKL